MLPPSSRLGPYEIIAPLDAGGMGEVYRARDARLRREVAVKILLQQFATDPERLARFEREAKAVAALTHSNILVLFDVGNADGIPYVVTELLEGETLHQRLKRGALPWREAAELGIAIADGLAAAHAKGIIHRDIKPKNIFLTNDGRTKILDFGLVRFETQVTRVAETRTYAPPVTVTGWASSTSSWIKCWIRFGEIRASTTCFVGSGCKQGAIGPPVLGRR